MQLKGSKTFQNLINAYAGECQAHVRYQFLAYGAKMNKLYEVECALKEISRNEFYHARMFYTEIQSSDPGILENLNVTGGYPFKEKWDLIQNLKLAADNEYEECALIYPGFAQTAKDEGFPAVAGLFELIAAVEGCHMKQLNELHRQITANELYSRQTPVKWKCSNCGHEQTTDSAPTECPLCKSEQGYVKLDLPDQ